MGIALCTVSSSAVVDEYSRYLAAGSEAAQQGRYASAKAEYEAAIAIDPDRPEAWYDMGLLYGQMADYVDAEGAFRQSLKLDPNSSKAHCRLGQTLVADPRKGQDWKAAVVEFREAVRLQPDYPEAQSFLGLGLNNLGETVEAVGVLKHAVELDPSLATSHLNLAVALETSNRLEEAVAEYQAALRVKPNAPDTEAALGSLYVRMGQLTQAEQEFRKALRLNPDLPNAHYGLARLLRTEKKLGEATVELSEAKELDQREPDRIQAAQLSNESLQLAAKADLAGAVGLLHKAILLKPDYGIAHYNLGLILADTGDFSGARDELIKAVSLLPVEAKAWFNLGRVLQQLGDTHGALETISWASWLAPTDASFAAKREELRAARASSASGTELAGTSASSSDALARPQPEFGAASDTALAHTLFASELRGRKDFPGAAGELRRALALQPDSIEARRDLADIYRSLANWEFSFLEYHKILLVAGEDESTHVALGNILMAEKNLPDAATEFRLALAQTPNSAEARAGLEAALHASGPGASVVH